MNLSNFVQTFTISEDQIKKLLEEEFVRQMGKPPTSIRFDASNLYDRYDHVIGASISAVVNYRNDEAAAD
jgi:hypothetical protein